MQRICTSLAENGYSITLVGRELPASLPLQEKKYRQKRLHCWFKKGKWFYAEFNIRLFFYLLIKKMDAICAIDLDTILPCLKISKWKSIPRIYDAHELFTELKEVRTRPHILKAWTRIEKRAVPKFKLGYTVSDGIAEEFKRRYNVDYKTIRSIPLLNELNSVIPATEKFILFQGAVNEARAFEYLVPAMQEVNCKLVVCGDGNFMPQLKRLIADYKLKNKIELKGMLPPDKLKVIAQQATIGIGLAEREGLNQWLALPNKFFDYIHAGLPQITMNYPEYRKINEQFEVAVLINDLIPGKIAETINNLLADEVRLRSLKDNCLKTRQVLNWQSEEKKLLDFYQSVFIS
ncbi:MAG: glycosyltransferase [Sphingobacteriales bacterium]|nr:glycosyltransferase [Sphingobacteriales bacterium]